MATISEMCFFVLNIGIKIIFERKQVETQLIKKNCTINEPNIVNFHMLLLIYTIDFWCCLEHYAWLGSSGFQDLFDKKNQRFLNISPEL